MKGVLQVAAVLTLTILVIPKTECANILAFYPYPAWSHHLVYWSLLKELALRGHNITMVSSLTMPDPPPNNYKELKVTNYWNQLEELEDTGFMMSSNMFIRFFQNSNFFMKMGAWLNEKILQEEAFQWLLKSDSEFDLIFGEWTFSEEIFVALHHRFSAINVEMTSFGNFHWTYWLYGQPFDPSYIADSDSCYDDKMSFSERLQNTMQSLAIRTLWSLYYMPHYQEVMDRHLRYPGWETRPPLMDMLRNTSLILMNTHYSFNYPYPNAPHFKEIGGINIQPPTPLPKNLQEFMDGASEGAIYFSLGSVLKGEHVLADEVQEAFIQVFRKLKQRVIWKWETPIVNMPSNLMIGKWFPQQSILAHRNCKLFISHAGFGSLTETVDQGVPVVAIPIWADQLRNARQMTSKGYAVKLDMNNLTSVSIAWAIEEVLGNPRYRKNAMRQSRIFRDKPETPLETAIYWTEYALRHKGAHHLRPAIATMPWYQQAMIDVNLALALLVMTPLFAMYYAIRSVCKMMCKMFRRKSTNERKRKKE